MTAPELSETERAVVERFYAAAPAPESITERVAAAMFEAISDRPWSEAGPLDRDGYRIEARAAVDAMKGPGL